MKKIFYLILLLPSLALGQAGAKCAKATVNAQTFPSLSSIAITPANATLLQDTSAGYVATATFSDATTQDVTTVAIWSTSNANIADLNRKDFGKFDTLRAKNVGSVTLSATLGGVTGSTTVTVVQDTIKTLAITGTPVIIGGIPQQFSAVGTFQSGVKKDVTSTVWWGTSDATLATIGAFGSGIPGKATEVATGTPIIQSNSCVPPPPPPPPPPTPVLPAVASTAPIIVGADIVSGPGTGGEGNNGVYVTIWGYNFGTSRGSSAITVGGGAIAQYKVWGAKWVANSNASDMSGLLKVTFQLGSSAVTGNIVMTTTNGASNGLPFTVRSGAILFVDGTNGNNANAGTFASPLKDPCIVEHTAAAGTTAYIRSGAYTTFPGSVCGTGWGGVINLEVAGGTAGNPIAFIAYPGETVALGASAGSLAAIRTPNVSCGASAGCFSHSVFSQFVIPGMTGQNSSGGGTVGFGSYGSTAKTSDIVFVGNDLSEVAGAGTACLQVEESDNVNLLFNYVHECLNTDAQHGHNLYYTSDSDHATVAYNEVDGSFNASSGGGMALRGVQFHSSPTGQNIPGTGTTNGQQQFDIHIHDNFFHDVHADCVNLPSVDPSKGTVEVFNNLMVRCGNGVPSARQTNYSAVYFNSATDTGSPGSTGSGSVQIYNNTIWDAGNPQPAVGYTNGAISTLGFAPNVSAVLTNNIIYQNENAQLESYFSSNSSPLSVGLALMTGDHNLFWDGFDGVADDPDPTKFTNSILGNDPLFMNQANVQTAGVTAPADLKLSSASPAPPLGTGINTHTSVLDFQGQTRPNPPSMGAYEQ